MDHRALPLELGEKIDSKEAIALAGKKAVYGNYREFLSHETETLSGRNIENLHRMRVATRRMRAVLKTMRPVYGWERVRILRDQLWRVARHLGELRDIDTFVLFLENCHTQLGDSAKPAVHQLIGDRQSTREAGRVDLIREFGRDWYRCMKEDIVSFLVNHTNEDLHSPPVKNALPPLMEEAYAQILANRDTICDAPQEELHRLRIQFKRLRYLCESFVSCYGKEMEDLIKEFIEFQDMLGAMQDHYRDAAFLRNIRRKSPPDAASSKGKSSLDELIEHFEQILKKERIQFFECWGRFTLKENEIRALYIFRNGIS